VNSLFSFCNHSFSIPGSLNFLNCSVNKQLIILCSLDRASLLKLKNTRPTWCHLLFYFTSYVFNMFRTLIYPSSGACDYSVELPHWDTTPTQPHRNSNTHRTKNNTTNVVIQQNTRELLMMDILMSETCWSLQHGYHTNPTTPKLQHTSSQEQYDQCGNSTE